MRWVRGFTVGASIGLCVAAAVGSSVRQTQLGPEGRV
jgi:hypothetical protein